MVAVATMVGASVKSQKCLTIDLTLWDNKLYRERVLDILWHHDPDVCFTMKGYPPARSILKPIPLR
jgi:hypothetical protein